MKKLHVLFIFLFVNVPILVFSQTTIAGWSFPTGTSDDAYPDVFSPGNSGNAISAFGTSAIDFTKNGLTTKAAQATNWEDGAETKFWQIIVNTTEFKQLTVSSVQQSGGTNAGPKYFKLQYSIDNGSLWNDIPNGTVEIANDWTTSAVNDLQLPEECENQETLYIRWLCTTTMSSNDNPVQANGVSKIDNIVVKGQSTTQVFEYSENSDFSSFISLHENDIQKMILYTLNGKAINIDRISDVVERLNSTQLPQGIYILEFQTKTERRIFKVFSE